MISIKKDFDTPPEKLVLSNRNEQIKDALLNKSKHDFKSSIYRDTVYDRLLALYRNKCAYCESHSLAAAPFQVEHFRPKKEKTKGTDKHTGYYWLGYEWSNLTLGCSSCNSSKGTHFPVKATRITKPLIDETTELPFPNYSRIDSDILKSEKAILLNPEIDEVEKHFYFLPNGEIVGIDERGKETIIKLKLNRQPLVFNRKKLLDDYLKELKSILEDFLTKTINHDQCYYAIKQVFIRIATQQNPEKPYSRFGYFMFYKFDIFFANQLEIKQKEAILKFFELFKNGK